MLAVGAHPDDIEFMMAGTLLLLARAGAEVHMWNVTDGSCGSAAHAPEDLALLRAAEARESADVAGAVLHPPIARDMAVFFEASLLSRAAGLLRTVKPDIMLVPAPDDYTEDHVNTSRLAVTAAFARGIPNFATEPASLPWEGEVVIYHAQPYGLRDPLARLVLPGWFVDVEGVMERKRDMLAAHRSQEQWLSRSQGTGFYLSSMEAMAHEVGRLSGRFTYAEGFRRHSHIGFCREGADPLSELLGARCLVDPGYEASLG